MIYTTYHKTGSYTEKIITITEELEAPKGFTWQICGEPKIQIEVKMEIDGKLHSRFFLFPADSSPSECEALILTLPQFENSTP